MKKAFIVFTGCVAVMILCGLGAAAGLYYWAAHDLPEFTKISDYNPPLVTTVLARDGSVMGQLYREKRFLLTLDEMPEYLPKAFLAAEDAEFYHHGGVDPVAIVRALITNLQSGHTVSGGSTITQQLIKQLVLSPERTYERKLKEAILAYRLERYLTKDEILTIYLNHTFLGANSYGVEAAARSYFGKHAKDLTIAECAILAGLPKAPTEYNPYRDPEAAKNRQGYVLRRLRECGWINDEQYAEAQAQPLIYTSMKEGIRPESAWYFEEVRRRLVSMLSEENVRMLGLELPKYGEDAVYELGFTVQTAMNPPQQAAATAALRHGLEAITKRQGWLGPVEKLAPAQLESKLREDSFVPTDLEDGAWCKAIVTHVEAKGADVRLGAWKGRIAVADMSWARIPNPKVSGRYAAAVKDARKVLARGDVVWVSTATKNRKKPFAAADIKPDTVISLALEQRPEVQGAIASIEPETGDVVALVGGYNFADNQFNRATQGRRQPGSAFKPIVYSTALDNGFTAGSVILDAPVVLLGDDANSTWRPSNFEGNFTGPILLRTALTKSRNLCTIRVAQQIGIPKVVERAQALGLEGDFPPVLSISLGAVAVSPLNLAQAYTAFAHGGLVSTPRLITEIHDRNGQLAYAAEPDLHEAITPQNAYVMAYLLKEVVNAGTGSKAKVLGRPLGGKTGTTNDEKDAWFVGVTPHLVTSVFVGYDTPKPLGRSETGSGAALPIFVEYGKKALDAYPPDDFAKPEGITMAIVDSRTGQLAGKGGKGLVLPFISGTEPTMVTSQDAQEEKSGEDLLKALF